MIFSLAGIAQQPFPLADASVRIQYTGPAGGVIAELASIDDAQDLVVDSHVVNEGYGWMGSGANPWHLDDQTESILFLTDMGDKPARMGFAVTVDGVSQALTSLQLNPHETRAINLRKLRDAQLPDFKRRKIPANASDGSVRWIRLDNVPVAGRMLMISRKGGLASNYDCCFCQCPPNYWGIYVYPAAVNVGPNQSLQAYAEAYYYDCNMCEYDFLVGPEWTVGDSDKATVNSAGVVTGKHGGTTDLNADYQDCIDYEFDGVCYCNLYDWRSNQATINSVAIEGPRTVWWFNGENPSGYATSITLTATPNLYFGSYSWEVLTGTGKAVLSGQSGNSINFSGIALSTSENDITVSLVITSIYWSTVYATQTFTVRGPYSFVPGYAPTSVPAFVDNINGTGYFTFATYTIEDNFSTPLPSVVPLNEYWSTSVVTDYSGENWVRRSAVGYTTTSGAPAGFADHIFSRSGSGLIPNPRIPQSPLGTTKVFHWGQEWRVGGTTPGAGMRVQTNTLHYYDDHGRHISITSPAP